MRLAGPLPRFPALCKHGVDTVIQPSLGDFMAEHTPSGPVELGAPMDYPEHERTFAGFIALTKVSVVATVAILQALVLFGIAANGFWLGVLMIVLTTLASIIGVIAKGDVKALAGVVVIGFALMALTLG